MIPLDVASLVAAIDSGQTFSYRLLWSHDARCGGRPTEACFSQWWPSAFDVDDQTYTTTEKWMMSSKARLFGDVASESAIMATDDPERIQALGQRVHGFAQEIWDARCFDIMTVGNIAKFGQSNELKGFLMATGDDVLVEASPLDVVWGVGLGRDAPDVRNPKAWRGKNLLGFSIMKARGVLRGEIEAP